MQNLANAKRRPSDSSLIPIFEAQPPTHQLFLEMTAFLDRCQTVGHLTRLYNIIVDALGQKRCTVSRLVNDLIERQLLEGDSWNGWACPPGILENVARSAAVRGTAALLQKICGDSHLASQSALSRSRRLLHCGYPKEFVKALADEANAIQVAAGIADPEVLVALPTPVALRLVQYILRKGFSHHRDLRPFLLWLGDIPDSENWPPMLTELVAGLTSFCSAVAPIPKVQTELSGAILELAGSSRKAALATITGMLDRAPWAPFPFPLQELLWMGACLAEGQDEVVRRRLPHSPKALSTLGGWLLEARSTDSPEVPREVAALLKRQIPEEVWLAVIALYWAGFSNHLSGELLRALVDFFEELGLGLCRAEAQALLSATEQNGEAGPLLSILTPKPGWERFLAQMASWLDKARSNAPPSERIAWFLRLDSAGLPIEFYPRLQKLSVKGGWSKGRQISENDVLYSDAAEERDKVLARKVHERRLYHDFEVGVIDPISLADLVGHPRVFADTNPPRPVTLSLLSPRLRLQREPAGLRVRLEPWPCDHRPCLAQKMDEDHFGITLLSPRLRELAALLGRQGEVLPEAAIPRAQSVFSRLLGQDLELVGEVPPELSSPEIKVADGQIRVRLCPFQGGLRCQVRVQPDPDRPEAFLPGRGPESWVRQVGGRLLTVRRDLKAEGQAWRKLRKAVPLLGKGEVVFPSPHDSLRLLAALRERPEGEVLVEWPRGARVRLRDKLDISALHLRARGRDDWFAIEGELHLSGEETLALAEVLDRLRRKEDFIQLEDGTFLALTEELKKRLAMLERASSGEARGLRLHGLAASLLDDLDVQGDEAWKQARHRIERATELQPEVPSNFRADLRGYQIEGFRWLARSAEWGVGVCLADDMGLGKTIQTLALLCRRASGGAALVVAPTSVGANWVDEAARFAPGLRVHLFSESDRAALTSQLGPGDLVVCTYGLMVREAALLAAVDWHTVVLDEAQAIKNATTQRARVAYSLKAGFRLATTGTPVENHLDELWALFRFLNPGLLGSKKSFLERFGSAVHLPEARAALAAMIRPFVLRRLKSHVLKELPPRTDITLRVELSREERVFYEGLRRDAIGKVEESDSKLFTVLVELTRLRRACCHPALIDASASLPSSKLRTFAKVLEEIVAGGHKALVFSQFVDHLKLAVEHAKALGLVYHYLDGATPVATRRKLVKAFQGGEGQVFFISLKAGGFGLNLTEASYVVHLDPWWNPAVEEQASDRAHRIGQTSPVTVYRLIASNTIEEKILRLHDEKRELADQLLQGTEQTAQLDVREIVALLQEGSSTFALGTSARS